MPKDKGRPPNKDGLSAKERHACQIRSEGETQVKAYCISHKVKDHGERTVHDRAYKLFSKPLCKVYLDELWNSKPLEVIYTPQRWLGHTLDLLAKAEDAENWPAVANLNKQAGQAVAALRDSMTVITDGAERDKEIIAAVAGEDPKRRKALELLMGKHEVFEPTLVVDNDGAPRLPRGGKGDKGE